MSDRQQRVILNGCESDWETLLSSVPQGSVLGPLLFLIYINDLTDNISADMRLFADDLSLFTKVNDVLVTHQKLSNDLDTITKWANQWKIKFNPDITKQTVEVIFSTKYKKDEHLTFNNIPVARQDATKHIGMILDEKLTFHVQIKEVIEKVKTSLDMMKYMSKYVNRKVLDQMYKMHVRPHLGYGDVIFHDQSQDTMKLLDSIQYQAGLIVTGCWKSTSAEKLYTELGWEVSVREEFTEGFASTTKY